MLKFLVQSHLLSSTYKTSKWRSFSRKVTDHFNNRLVSLTCVPCKLLEHIVCSNIMAHLDEYNLLSDRQHACISKLFNYGIGGKTVKWIDYFLCFRQQQVVVNGIKSDWAPVLLGVPQGTVLGPLFSLYINDITSDIESEIRLFADDCVRYLEIKDEEDTVKPEGSRRSMLHIP